MLDIHNWPVSGASFFRYTFK